MNTIPPAAFAAVVATIAVLVTLRSLRSIACRAQIADRPATLVEEAQPQVDKAGGRRFCNG